MEHCIVHEHGVVFEVSAVLNFSASSRCHELTKLRTFILILYLFSETLSFFGIDIFVMSRDVFVFLFQITEESGTLTHVAIGSCI